MESSILTVRPPGLPLPWSVIIFSRTSQFSCNQAFLIQNLLDLSASIMICIYLYYFVKVKGEVHKLSCFKLIIFINFGQFTLINNFIYFCIYIYYYFLKA